MDSARGWAGCILFNKTIKDQFEWYAKQEDRFTLGVWIAHGEGRCYWPDASVMEEAKEKGCIAMRYVDNESNVRAVVCSDV